MPAAKATAPSRVANAASVLVRPSVPLPVKAVRGRTPPRAPKRAKAPGKVLVRVASARVAPVVVAVVVVVAAEGATASEQPRRYAPGSGAAAHHVTEWTDRALGDHAGSAVGRVWGLGAVRVDSRGARAHGRLAHAGAHGVQGHANTLREGHCAVPGDVRWVAGCVHRARAHVLSGARAGR